MKQEKKKQENLVEDLNTLFVFFKASTHFTVMSFWRVCFQHLETNAGSLLAELMLGLWFVCTADKTY